MTSNAMRTLVPPSWCGARIVASCLLALAGHSLAIAGSADDEKAVADLDVQYQAAVERGDATTMARILADDFVLTTGSGKTYSKSDLLDSARDSSVVYERQVASSRTVRVWGDTAVVTALLWLKGTNAGKPFDYRLWYSDTYARFPSGWRYVFGQASLPLPNSGQPK